MEKKNTRPVYYGLPRSNRYESQTRRIDRRCPADLPAGAGACEFFATGYAAGARKARFAALPSNLDGLCPGVLPDPAPGGWLRAVVFPAPPGVAAPAVPMAAFSGWQYPARGGRLTGRGRRAAIPGAALQPEFHAASQAGDALKRLFSPAAAGEKCLPYDFNRKAGILIFLTRSCAFMRQGGASTALQSPRRVDLSTGPPGHHPCGSRGDSLYVMVFISGGRWPLSLCDISMICPSASITISLTPQL